MPDALPSNVIVAFDRKTANAHAPKDAQDFIGEVSQIALTLDWIYHEVRRDIERDEGDVRSTDWERLEAVKTAVKAMALGVVKQNFWCAWEDSP